MLLAGSGRCTTCCCSSCQPNNTASGHVLHLNHSPACVRPCIDGFLTPSRPHACMVFPCVLIQSPIPCIPHQQSQNVRCADSNVVCMCHEYIGAQGDPAHTYLSVRYAAQQRRAHKAAKPNLCQLVQTSYTRTARIHQHQTAFLANLIWYLQIPYAMVRTHSDFLQKPIVQTGNGLWETSPDALPQNFDDGYPYAIATGSTAVLTMLQTRCHAIQGVNSAACRYALARIFSD